MLQHCLQLCPGALAELHVEGCSSAGPQRLVIERIATACTYRAVLEITKVLGLSTPHQLYKMQIQASLVQPELIQSGTQPSKAPCYHVSKAQSEGLQGSGPCPGR